MSEPQHRGSCLCGAVTFEVHGPISSVSSCHCTLCRKWTGHFEAGGEVKRAALSVRGEVRWYQSSEKVRRGFCPTCGSSMFFDPLDTKKHDWTGISMGCLDGPSGVQTEMHIFVADKGDYYTLADGLPQNEQ